MMGGFTYTFRGLVHYVDPLMVRRRLIFFSEGKLDEMVVAAVSDENASEGCHLACCEAFSLEDATRAEIEGLLGKFLHWLRFGEEIEP